MRTVVTISVLIAAFVFGSTGSRAASATAEELALAKVKAKVAVITENYADAILPLELLARNNDAFAQNMLGSFYIKGLAVSKNVEHGVKLLQKSADQGYIESLYQLGMMTTIGLGVPADKIKGAALIKRSADGEDVRGILMLAVMYSEGEGGVPKDATMAHMWANIGAAYGDHACTELRDGLEHKLSRGEISESNRMSRVWFDQHPHSEK